MVYLMERRLFVFVLTGAFANVAFAQFHYNFVNTSVNWTDAQHMCRDLFTDLATIESSADAEAVLNPIYAGKAWIGLHDDLINSWMWSLNDSSFYGEGEDTYRNWFTGQPNNLNGQEYCVQLLSGSPYFGRWIDSTCSLERQFVCFNGTLNGTATFVRIETLLNWTEAQRFCRENYVDLASIRNQTENEMVRSITDGNFVWIGLYRQKIWSDGSVSLYRNWDSSQPDSGEEQCVATSFESGLWSDESCSIQLPFVCYTAADVENFRSIRQDETSVTLQWNKVNDDVSFILQFNGVERRIIAGFTPVTHTAFFLTAATEYRFTLYSVFEDIRSSGISITAVTAPPSITSLGVSRQNESSVTLQWNKVNNNIIFILQFNGTETNITAADGGDGPVTHTVSSLNAATEYTFTVDSVFGNVRSSGVSITAVTAPPSITSLGVSRKNESSVTLQWSKVNNNISFILQFNGTETNITAPDGDGPVTHTVSSLTPSTIYTFTVYSVFENVRSSGVSITAVTEGPHFVVGLKVRLSSDTELSQTEIQALLDELVERYGSAASQLLSVKIKSVTSND
ncbi:uncharacterized protein LOC115386097 isoform X4 [Salarias fasciatus]|uniref:uncharacterized protein LOC115386097 isoform X4 n=1 Tax=Salarias fasciatus TaxID=181472 RepID=UPI001176B1C5|nr:uncharacterized protein LOC115386097 isoform X4 [Salarias fasciatus]